MPDLTPEFLDALEAKAIELATSGASSYDLAELAAGTLGLCARIRELEALYADAFKMGWAGGKGATRSQLESRVRELERDCVELKDAAFDCQHALKEGFAKADAAEARIRAADRLAEAYERFRERAAILNALVEEGEDETCEDERLMGVAEEELDAALAAYQETAKSPAVKP